VNSPWAKWSQLVRIEVPFDMNIALCSGDAEAMTAKLTPQELTRLVKFLGMLGSDHAGERANAGGFASRMIRERGLTWAEIIGGRAEEIIVVVKPGMRMWLIHAKYRGTCFICERDFKVGAIVAYRRGVGCAHAKCFKKSQSSGRNARG
jgi:hypothetical protein